MSAEDYIDLLDPSIFEEREMERMAKHQNFSGTVSRVNAKNWQDRTSGEDIVLYSFLMDETGDRWFRTGTTQAVQEGQSIQFIADAQKNNVDIDSIEVVKSEVAKAPKVTAPPTRSSGSSSGTARPSSGSALSKDQYWSNKEAKDVEKDKRYQEVDIPRMTFCTAQDAAVALVTAAVAQGILPKAGSKKADQLDSVLDSVDELTERFFAQRMARCVDGAERAGAELEDISVEGTDIE